MRSESASLAGILSPFLTLLLQNRRYVGKRHRVRHAPQHAMQTGTPLLHYSHLPVTVGVKNLSLLLPTESTRYVFCLYAPVLTSDSRTKLCFTLALILQTLTSMLHFTTISCPTEIMGTAHISKVEHVHKCL